MRERGGGGGGAEGIGCIALCFRLSLGRDHIFEVLICAVNLSQCKTKPVRGLLTAVKNSITEPPRGVLFIYL